MDARVIWVLILLWIIFQPSEAYYRCQQCYCQSSTGTISCVGLSLRAIPTFSSRTRLMARFINLRNNFLTEISIEEMRNFPNLNYMDISQNQINCKIIQDLRQIITIKSDCDEQTTIVIEKHLSSVVKMEDTFSTPQEDSESTEREDSESTERVINVDITNDMSELIVWIVISSTSTTLLIGIGIIKYKSKVHINIYLKSNIFTMIKSLLTFLML